MDNNLLLIAEEKTILQKKTPVSHSEWINSISDIFPTKNVLSKKDFDSLEDIKNYEVIIVLAELSWHSNLLIEEQIAQVNMGGFSILEILRKEKGYKGKILVLSLLEEKRFWNKGLDIMRQGAILQEDSFHPFFNILDSSLVQNIRDCILTSPKRLMSRGRLDEVCREYFTLEGKLRIFFHDLLGINNLTKSEIQKNLNQLKNELWKQNHTLLSKIIENHIENIEKEKIILLKDKLIDSCQVEIINPKSNNIDKIGNILYIEDDNEWQNKVKCLFKVEGITIISASSWEEAEIIIQERNIQMKSRSTNPNKIFDNLINAVIVDARLLTENGRKQLYQGIDIIEELPKLGYFSIIVLTHSDRFVKDHVAHNRNMIMGFSKTDIGTEVGQKIFLERVIDSGVEVALKKHFLCPTSSPHFTSETIQKYNYNSLKYYYENFIGSDMISNLENDLIDFYKKISDNYYRNESSMSRFLPNEMPCKKYRITTEGDFYDKHVKIRLYILGFVVEIILNEMDSFESENWQKNISSKILDKWEWFFGNGCESITETPCIHGGLRDTQVFNKILSLKNTEKLEDTIRISIGYFYWWEIIFIKNIFHQKYKILS